MKEFKNLTGQVLVKLCAIIAIAAVALGLNKAECHKGDASINLDFNSDEDTRNTAEE